MFLLGNVPYNKLKLYNCFIFGLKWLQSYISYYFGFKRIFVLGERITCVYSLFAVILFVCKFECNILRVCSAFGCICVDEFVCMCICHCVVKSCSWHTCMPSAFANTGNLILQGKWCLLLSLFEIHLVWQRL